MDGYFYIPYNYLLEKRLINYLDGLWAITDIIPRSNHKPTVRRLVVPGHNHDERHIKDHSRKQMNPLSKMMMMLRGGPSRQHTLQRRLSMPMFNGTPGHYWYR